MSDYWEIEEGNVDSARFFQAQLKFFPEATTFYAEGTAIAEDVRTCYEAHKEEGAYLPQAQTLFWVSQKFRCKFSASFMNQLAQLADHHAEPELLDHLSLYKQTDALVFWHDAFANVLLISRSIPESVVSQLASELGLGYQ